MAKEKSDKKRPRSSKGRDRRSSLSKEPYEDAGAGKASPDLKNKFPIVGIGASAGGLAAFEAFFSGMPADIDPGMAFVLVQHLAPDHKSILSELVNHYTRMAVFEVEDGMVVRPNCAYIIPPNRDMAFLNGTLQLIAPTAPRGRRMPIDFFFRSLAQDQRDRAICVVLSGTGSDGTLGVRDIKGEGGMVMVQSVDSAQYDGMPRSALATGLVDYELAPDEMPSQIIAYAAHAFGKSHRPGTVVSVPTEENALQKIFALLRAQTGHDFSQYKPRTISRRISHRMAVQQIESIEAYIQFVQRTPIEVEALFRDLLIGVTSFFRDNEVFAVIEKQVIPELFEGKQVDTGLRIWTPGCSTGEEAYSFAILLAEYQESLKRNFTVQIFATDIDASAIAAARAGLYPASIAADISPDRLSRYFTAEPDGSAYRVSKTIRDMLIFSEQDMIKDPPFSKLDLISCRNVLIYMSADLQKKIIPLFHYALNPRGFLVLGSSETIGDFHNLFSPKDRKQKIYRKQESFDGIQRSVVDRIFPSATLMDGSASHAVGKAAAVPKLPMRELTEQSLLRQIAPAAALVNAQGDILYLHGRTGMYLEHPPGEVGISNILKMAREGLARALTASLHKAVTSGKPVSCPNLRVKTNGDFSIVNLTIRVVAHTPVGGARTVVYLVILTPVDATFGESEAGAGLLSSKKDIGIDFDNDAQAHIAALQQELRAKEEYLRSTNEELETANEELKSSNEEMQSINEELQSTNEELETSKEELQSVNEELSTVNAELQTKVAELTRANNDMNNLLAGTGIGTIFVDHSMRIVRFTPAATQIINLIHSDVGRPVGHIVSNLVGYDALLSDTQVVLDTLAPKEVEVQTINGRWYTLRIQPYRTMDNVIEGAVITFVDISATKKSQTDRLDADR